jgi:hypothetical protein
MLPWSPNDFLEYSSTPLQFTRYLVDRYHHGPSSFGESPCSGAAF